MSVELKLLKFTTSVSSVTKGFQGQSRCEVHVQPYRGSTFYSEWFIQVLGQKDGITGNSTVPPTFVNRDLLYCKKIPPTEWFKQLIFVISQFQRCEVPLMVVGNGLLQAIVLPLVVPRLRTPQVQPSHVVYLCVSLPLLSCVFTKTLVTYDQDGHTTTVTFVVSYSVHKAIF